MTRRRSIRTPRAAGARPPARTSDTKFASRRRPSSPLRSGWNWTPSRLPRATAETKRPPCSVSARITSSAVVRRRTGIRMDEVEVGPVGDPVEERVVAPPDDLVPADVRQRRGVLEPSRAAGQHAERLGAVLVARPRTAAAARGRRRGTACPPRSSRRSGPRSRRRGDGPSPVRPPPRPGRRCASAPARASGSRATTTSAPEAVRPCSMLTRLPAP